jgi:hypothetical protein
MSDAEWPAPEPATPREPERRGAPLPRVEDLPIAEQGYDREKVREAFDAFYRHAAQLDATLGTLEAVEVFQRTSAELRAELRHIRGSGWTVQSWQGGTGYARAGGRGRVSEWTLPPSFPRLAGEFVFLILIGVVVGVVGWPPLTIVLVMGLALGVVLLLEWVAARERAIPRTAAPAAAPDLDREEPAELSVGKGWVPPQEGPEALTMLDDPAVAVPVAEAEPEPEVVEPESEVAEPEPEAEEPPPPTAEAEPVQPEPPEESVEPADTEERPMEPAERLDPWEQEPELPDLPEEEAQVVEPPRHSWFRSRALEEPPVEPEPKPEPVAEALPEPVPEPEPEPQGQGPLPVDDLAGQTAAARERSRARRRAPRRARRR